MINTERLAAYIESKMYEPFAWGSNDCAMFVKYALDEILEDSPAASIVPYYDSAEGAIEFLKSYGAEDLWSFVDTMFERIPVAYATRGDIVGHRTADNSIGLCVGGRFLTPAAKGLSVVPMAEAVTAWRVK